MDTVEALRLLLKIRESKGQRIMQDVMQKLMMEQMGGRAAARRRAGARADRAGGQDGRGVGLGRDRPGGLRLAQGDAHAANWHARRGAQAEGRLRREAPEFAAIIRILERLEGQTPSAPPTAGGGGGAAAAPAAAVPPAVEDTSGMTMQVKKLDAPVEGGRRHQRQSVDQAEGAGGRCAGAGARAAATAAAARAAGAGAARAARGARGERPAAAAARGAAAAARRGRADGEPFL